MGYVPADAVCLCDENSVSEGSKCGESAYGSTGIPAASEPEKLREAVSWIFFSRRL
jgi:hypothetical protein